MIYGVAPETSAYAAGRGYYLYSILSAAIIILILSHRTVWHWSCPGELDHARTDQSGSGWSRAGDGGMLGDAHFSRPLMLTTTV